MKDDQIDPLVGDRERSAVDARLREALSDGVLTLGEYEERTALCWAARTSTELQAVTRDLPAARTETTPAAQEPDDDEEQEPSRAKRLIGGLLAAAGVGGAAVLGISLVQAEDGTAVLSSHTVQVPEGQDRVEVGMLMGSVEIVVPEGVRVRTTGTLLFSSTDCVEACQGAVDDPELVVDIRGAMGSVDILTRAEFDAEENDDD